tara:strand:+ start:126 stop:1889 length:1764 start_codon:yes stop_codon:yes gene_type:complete
MVLIKLFKDLFFRFPRHFILLFIFIFFQSALNIISVIAVAPLTDYLLERHGNTASKITQYLESLFLSLGISFDLLQVCIFFGLVMFFNGLAAVAAWHAILKIKYDLLIYLLSDALGQFFKAKFLFFSQGNMGRLLNTFQQEVIKIGDSFASMAKFFANLLQMIILFSLPLIFNPKLTIIFISVAAIISAPLWFLRKISYGLGKANTETANITTGILHETLSAAKLILGFGRQEKTLNRYKDSLIKHSAARIKFQTLEGGIGNLFLPLGVISVLVALYAAYLDNMPLGDMALVLFAFLRLMPVIGLLIQGKVSVEGFLPAYEQLESLKNEAKKYEESKGKLFFSDLKKGLNFNNVSFNYPEKRGTLDKINLKIPKGQMTALVGKSGAGKTTVVDLMLGLYEQTEGEIFLENEPLKNYNLNSYRQRIGFVPQDPQLLNTSIRENLLWSKPDASEKEIWEACRLSNSEEFILNLPKKLETILGERGVRLSGGQRQRLSLARAIIRKPELLFLDEATSSLDTESEKLIQKSINELASEMTIIVIAHRLSTIRNVDYVYVLEDGKLVEEGTHNELSNKHNGKLAKMITDQEI